ncbi:hypothetical protein AALO_G00051130 [Alosa alosa]|uniref:Methyltransferase domain-containing protein n=2 Tax=Alosa TaxID=34772 RepID=A0AAV6H4N3_9TELE|nr:uncharacterized methyltransferase YdaC isoform X1 [Alosa sapidissima]XP_048097843.1 uncharacterized methyltransferase YdaC [Alosa alosa]KAG5281999.1 hypothetical protein AALO_G00051130 [Alosa alosa]
MSERLQRMFLQKLGPQLGRPTQSVAGWITAKVLTRRNRVLEENAVKLCDISPQDTVLELGHGPGVGLEAAARLLSGPKGRLLGIDYSEYMHQVASDKMQELIASGKVTLYHCDVASMPISESNVDKVFHCNCYYFWPDLKKGTSEIHRVMKPGGLMVTTLSLNSLEHMAPTNIFTGESWRPDMYMEALRATGFSDVRMENRTNKLFTFQVVFATALK